MKPGITVITIGVDDLEASLHFHEPAMVGIIDWPALLTSWPRHPLPTHRSSINAQLRQPVLPKPRTYR